MFFSLREDGEDVYHTSLCGDYEFEQRQKRLEWVYLINFSGNRAIL